MKRLLIILSMLVAIVQAQTIDTLKLAGIGNRGKFVYYNHYTLPLTATKYFTGFGTFGSLPDTVRTFFSVDTSRTSGGAIYNPVTGVFQIPKITGGGISVSTFTKNAGRDSIILTLSDGTRFAVKDSIGSGGGGSGWSLSGNAVTAGVDFMGSTNNTSVRFRTNNTERFVLDSIGNAALGNTTAAVGATPLYLSLGGTYGNNSLGNANNLKLRITDASGNISGIGASTGYIEFQAPLSGAFGFTINHTTTKVLDITSSAVQSTNPFVSYVASTTKNGFLTFGTFGSTQNSGMGNSAANAADLSLFVGFSRNMLFGHNVDASTITATNADLWLSGSGNWTSGTATENTIAKWNYNSTTQSSLFIPRMTTAQRDAILGKILTGAITTQGSGYSNGTFTLQSLTGGSGSGAVATITVAGGLVTVVTITTAGQGYLVGDVLSASLAGGSGFQWTVSTVSNGLGSQVYNTTIGAVNTNNINNSYQGDFVSSSAGTLTLKYGVDYVFTGTTATYTLPAISATLLGRQNGIKIKNRGSGTITLNTATGSTLYTTSAVSTINIVAGAACELMPDGTYNLVMYNQ